MTPAQQATLKADIIAKSQSGQPLEAMVAINDWQNVAAYYNTENSPTNVWRPDAPKSKVFGAIVWKNLRRQTSRTRRPFTPIVSLPVSLAR